MQLLWAGQGTRASTSAELGFSVGDSVNDVARTVAGVRRADRTPTDKLLHVTSLPSLNRLSATPLGPRHQTNEVSAAACLLRHCAEPGPI